MTRLASWGFNPCRVMKLTGIERGLRRFTGQTIDLKEGLGQIYLMFLRF